MASIIAYYKIDANVRKKSTEFYQTCVIFAVKTSTIWKFIKIQRVKMIKDNWSRYNRPIQVTK
jgi:hypothetical protein